MVTRSSQGDFSADGGADRQRANRRAVVIAKGKFDRFNCVGRVDDKTGDQAAKE